MKTLLPNTLQRNTLVKKTIGQNTFGKIPVNVETEWPEPVEIGTLWEESTWADLSRFTQFGTGSATFTPTDGDLVITGGAAAGPTQGIIFTDTLSNHVDNSIDKYTITINFQVVATAAQSLYVGTRGSNTSNNGDEDISVLLRTDNGVAQIRVQGTGVSTGAAMAGGFSNGDEARIVITRDIIGTQNLISVVFTNLTTGQTCIPTPYALNTFSGTPSQVGMYRWALWARAGTQHIHDITVTSNAKKNCEFAFVGDSITSYKRAGTAGATTNYTNRYASVLAASTGKVTEVFAGSGDRLQNMIARVNELKAFNPRNVLLMGGTNNVSNGNNSAQINAWYSEFNTALQAALPNTKLVHLYCIPRGDAVNVNGVANSQIPLYTPAPFLIIPETFSALVGVGDLLDAAYNSGDNVHPNAAGHALIASTIEAEISSLL